MDNYSRIRVIGKGSYGEVWLVRHKRDKKQYVLKRMNLCNASEKERKAAELEAKLLSKLKHPNIVSYKDSFETGDGYLYIAMGFCEGGDLYTRLKQQKGEPLEEKQVVEWFVQIAMALQYMHERNILHRDLKTQNIFLTRSKIIKLGDLGIARVLESASDMATTLIGTPYYMSPELFSNKPYNHKSDVWALGCCVYEMATLKHAFNARDMNSLMYKVLKGFLPAMPEHYSLELTELIKQMLNQNPDKRPSVNKILRNPFIKKYIAMFLENARKSRPNSSTGAANNQLKSESWSGSSSSKLQPASDGSSGGSQSQSQLATNGSISSNDLSIQELDSDELSVAGGADGGGRRQLTPIMEVSVTGSSVSHLHPHHPQQQHRRASAAAGGGGQHGIEPIPEHVKASPVHQVRRGSDPLIMPKKKTGSKRPKKQQQSKVLSAIMPGHLSDNGSRRSSASSDTPDSDNSTPNGGGNGSRILKKPRKKNNAAAPVPGGIAKNGKRKVSPPSQQGQSKVSSGKSSASESVGEGKASAVGVARPHLPPIATQSQQHCDVNVSSSSSSSSSSYDNNHSPKLPLRPPNSSARARRRQKLAEEREAASPPTTPHQVSSRNGDDHQQQQGRVPTSLPQLAGAGSRRTAVTEGGDKPDTTADKPVSDTKKDHMSSDRKKSEGEKDMDNFITLLDSTLKLERQKMRQQEELEEERRHHHRSAGSHADDSDEFSHSGCKDNNNVKQQQQSEEQTAQGNNGKLNPPVIGMKTLGTSGRLNDRIQALRRDCQHGLGLELLQQAYDVLDKYEGAELQAKLISILGNEKYEIYGGKIWQLKFCEDSMLRLN